MVGLSLEPVCMLACEADILTLKHCWSLLMVTGAAGELDEYNIPGLENPPWQVSRDGKLYLQRLLK